MAYIVSSKREKRKLSDSDLSEMKKNYVPLKPIKSLSELPKEVQNKIDEFVSGFKEVYPLYLYGGYSKGKHRTKNPDIDIYCHCPNFFTQEMVENLQNKYNVSGIDYKVSKVKLEYSFKIK